MVGGPRSGKTTALRSAAAALSWPLLNLNVALAERLLAVPVKHRDVRVSDLAHEVAANHPGEGLIVDNIELLFQVDLKADTGALLRSLSRQRPVIAAWPGELTGTTLTYATSLHPEYTAWSRPEARILQLSGFAE